MKGCDYMYITKLLYIKFLFSFLVEKSALGLHYYVAMSINEKDFSSLMFYPYLDLINTYDCLDSFDCYVKERDFRNENYFFK